LLKVTLNTINKIIKLDEFGYNTIVITLSK
jgi:hypothetical protein